MATTCGKQTNARDRALPLLAAGLFFIGGLALLGVLIPPVTRAHIVRSIVEASVGAGLYLIGTRLTYALLDKETFMCKSLFYWRRIPVSEISGFKKLPNIPVPSFFVIYRDGGEEKRANIVSTVFG